MRRQVNKFVPGRPVLPGAPSGPLQGRDSLPHSLPPLSLTCGRFFFLIIISCGSGGLASRVVHLWMQIKSKFDPLGIRQMAPGAVGSLGHTHATSGIVLE